MKPLVFYGWLLVAITLFMQSIGVGTTLYLYSVIASSIGEDFPTVRSLLMMGSTGMLVAACLWSPMLGKILDRYPIKWIYTTGAALLGLGFVLLSLSTEIWHVIACYLLFIGVGLPTLGPLAASTLLSRWFVRYRGLAVGISCLGSQLGALVYTPVVASIIEIYDWRIAIFGLGVFVVIVVPAIAYLWVVDHPQQKNLQPDGNNDPVLPNDYDVGKALEVKNLPFRQLCRQRNFILLMLIIGGTGGLSNTAVLSNLSLFATDMGEPVTRGAFLISLFAFSGIFVSPLTGWLCDFLNIKFVTALLVLFMAFALLIFSVADSYALLLIATFFFGVASGGFFPLWASLVGRLYDARVYGQVMGVTAVGVFGGAAIGPLFAGWVYDITESYRLLFITFFAMQLVLTFLVMLISVPGAHSQKFGADNTDRPNSEALSAVSP